MDDSAIGPWTSRLLVVAFRHRVMEPDAEAGLDRVMTLVGDRATRDDMRLAVAQALSAAYIHDPVRLQAGALQCHWHLELTPRGVDAVRRLQTPAGGFP